MGIPNACVLESTEVPGGQPDDRQSPGPALNRSLLSFYSSSPGAAVSRIVRRLDNRVPHHANKAPLAFEIIHEGWREPHEYFMNQRTNKIKSATPEHAVRLGATGFAFKSILSSSAKRT